MELDVKSTSPLREVFVTQVFMYEVKSHTVHRNNIGYLNKVSYYRNNGDIQFQIPVLSSSYRYFVICPAEL